MEYQGDSLWDKPPLEEYLAHYGTPRHSGRYPWGSGKNKYQHGSMDFIGRVEELRGKNFTYVDDKGKKWTGDNAIAKSMGLSTTQFRVQYSLAKDERRHLNVDAAKRLAEKEGLNPTEIGRKMGVNESTVRSWLNEESAARMNRSRETADFLRNQIKKKGIIDIGKGVEKELGVSPNKLDEAVYMLELEGYKRYKGRLQQINRPGQFTTLDVIGPKNMEYKELYDSKNIKSVKEYKALKDSEGNDVFTTFQYPESISSKRVSVVYAEQGGTERDGLVELRRGCKDLDLGGSNYSQVRIMVDGSHYIKGMAVYSDDLPDGVDVRFNTNKHVGTPLLSEDKNNSVLKPIKSDPANPFGSLIKEKGGQYYYDDPATGERKLGAINKRSDEGDWDKWSDKLPSQFLAKQNMDLIKRQIKITKDERKAEYDEICSLTNPTVKKKLLQDFADGCDGASADLKLAALPRQKYKVLLPVPSLKDNECYCPTLEDGEKVALIRFPHGGTFEIPVLTVNNKNKEAIKMMGKNAKDAIGINARNAEQLSGADFDGDTAQVIPCAGNGRNMAVKITSRDSLPGLKGFDSKMYKYDDTKVGPDGETHYYRNGKEFKIMKKTQTEMGIISNLITDMTIRGAKDDELARAVRHSMVVIDAEKHKLDYRQSYIDNDIASLKKIYQKHTDEYGNEKEGGASTLFSRAGAKVDIPKRKGSATIDPETGKKIYKLANETYVDTKTGETKTRMEKTKRMYTVDDAHLLSSGSPKERVYADYANYMKALGNQARKEMLSTSEIKYNKDAATKYKGEVKQLLADLEIAELNRPRERRAQTIANARLKERQSILEADGDIPRSEMKKELKKIGQQELTKARAEVGAKKQKITITDKEWEAIQAGAISPSRLKSIMSNCDMDSLRERAMPKNKKTITQSQINRMKAYASKGYTTAEIAKALGVSTSTVNNYIE